MNFGVFVVGLILGVPSLAPIEEGVYRVNAFSEVAREILQADEEWRTCGNYFAAIHSPGGKVVYFTLGASLFDDGPSIPALPEANRITVRVNRELMVPKATVQRGGFGTWYYTIWMNLQDYATGFPCFGKSVRT